MNTCTKCKKEKSDEEFKSLIKKTLNKLCRPCLDRNLRSIDKTAYREKFGSEYKAKWRESNREALKVYHREYKARNKVQQGTVNK